MHPTKGSDERPQRIELAREGGPPEHLTVDADALAEVLEMRRGEETCALARSGEDAREERRGRALTLRARDQDRGEGALWRPRET
jgi:hypothetical protein